eukprot:6177055-Amphidinium_carterae.1
MSSPGATRGLAWRTMAAPWSFGTPPARGCQMMALRSKTGLASSSVARSQSTSSLSCDDKGAALTLEKPLPKSLQTPNSF